MGDHFPVLTVILEKKDPRRWLKAEALPFQLKWWYLGIFKHP